MKIADCGERARRYSIPPTAVGGLFKSGLQGGFSCRNPTNGSWWIVQVQPPFAGYAHQFSAQATGLESVCCGRVEGRT